MADERQLLTDLRIEVVPSQSELRPLYVFSHEKQRLPGRESVFQVDDLSLVTGRDNLGQAVVIRLLTPRGELAALGHPDYGSRVPELVGRPNTETTRNLLKLYILEALGAEPRIAKTLAVTVAPDDVNRDLIWVTIQVQPIAQTGIVTIGPFTLEL